MSVSQPGPVAPVAALVQLAALKLPQRGVDGNARQADQLTLSPPPTIRTLWQMALAGQQQLATLLPMLERSMQADPAPLPLGHLARALGDAAHFVDAGATVISAEPDPDRPGAELYNAWRQTTQTALNDTSNLLARAEHILDATPQPLTHPNPDMLWAMSQIVGAQRQVGLALCALTFAAKPRPATASRRQPAGLNGAIAVVGIALLLLLYALVTQAWLVLAGVGGSVVTAAIAVAWGWRVVVSSRRLKLELRGSRG